MGHNRADRTILSLPVRTDAVTLVGMYGQGGKWVSGPTNDTLQLTAGGKSKISRLIDGNQRPTSYLLSVTFDTTLLTMSAVRFIRRLGTLEGWDTNTERIATKYPQELGPGYTTSHLIIFLESSFDVLFVLVETGPVSCLPVLAVAVGFNKVQTRSIWPPGGRTARRNGHPLTT